MNKQSKDYKARKKIGQFFTEIKLAEKLIEMFELDFNNKVIVEPSCGDGVFIKQIIKKSPLFKNIIGIDIDKKALSKLSGLSDNIELIGDRYYIKAIVTVVDTETGETLTNSALAREEENKKGMDSSQVTGSTSSYARKYALNGMFLIDDTKDSDFTNTHGKENNEEKLSRIKGTGLSEAQIKRLYAIAAKANIEKSMVLKAIKQEFKVEKAELLTKDQYDELCARLEKKIK